MEPALPSMAVAPCTPLALLQAAATPATTAGGRGGGATTDSHGGTTPYGGSAYKPVFGDVVAFVMDYLTIRELLAVEIASRDAWLHTTASHGGGAWKTVRETQFRWANSTAQFLLDVSASKKRGVLGLLREVTREVGLGCPGWDPFRRRRVAMRRFVSHSCACETGDVGTCSRLGCGQAIQPDPARCFHGPIPTEPSFDGDLRTYCSAECCLQRHGSGAAFPWDTQNLMRVLDRGSDRAVVHQFATAFGGFARLVFLSLHKNLPRTRARNLRRVLALLVRHRPDVFPVRSWALVGPQFVPMFDDLVGLGGVWSLQALFRRNLQWYDLSQDLQQLTLSKAREIRDMVVEHCQVPIGTPMGAVATRRSLVAPRTLASATMRSAAFPAGGVGTPKVSTLPAVALRPVPVPSPIATTTATRTVAGKQGVFASPTVMSMTPDAMGLRSRTTRAGRVSRTGTARSSSASLVSPRSPLSTPGVGGGQPATVRRSTHRAGVGSPVARGSLAPPHSPAAVPSPSTGSRSALASASAVYKLEGGAHSIMSLAEDDVDNFACTVVRTTPQRPRDRRMNGGREGASVGADAFPPHRGPPSPLRLRIRTTAAPSNQQQTPPAGLGGGETPVAGQPVRWLRGVSAASSGGSGSGGGSGGGSGAVPSRLACTDATPPLSPLTLRREVDDALVAFLDALLHRGGVACGMAWQWLSDLPGPALSPRLGAAAGTDTVASPAHGGGRGGGNSHGAVRAGGGVLETQLERVFRENNGLAMLCAAIDCPQPVNKRQAAVVFAIMLRAVGCVRVDHGRIDVSLQGSPLVSVWCKRARVGEAATPKSRTLRSTKQQPSPSVVSFPPTGRGRAQYSRHTGAGAVTSLRSTM